MGWRKLWIKGMESVVIELYFLTMSDYTIWIGFYLVMSFHTAAATSSHWWTRKVLLLRVIQNFPTLLVKHVYASLHSNDKTKRYV